jgi:hypothetical protein
MMEIYVASKKLAISELHIPREVGHSQQASAT